MGISALADDKVEGTEVLILRLVLTSATQTAVDNAGNIFFQDSLSIRVIDVTGNYKLNNILWSIIALTIKKSHILIASVLLQTHAES